MADEIPEGVATFRTCAMASSTAYRSRPEQSRRWLEGKQALGHMLGEPAVEEDGRLVEEHQQPPDAGY